MHFFDSFAGEEIRERQRDAKSSNGPNAVLSKGPLSLYGAISESQSKGLELLDSAQV